MGVRRATLGLPIIYQGWDDFNAYANAKNIAETGWVFVNDRWGAPFDTCFLDFPPYFLDNFGNMLTKIILKFTNNYVLALNINYYLIPFISFTLAFFVMQSLKISRIFSACGAVLFALLPFYFMRNIFHFVLSEYYFVPLSILLCFWCYEDKIAFFPVTSIYKNKCNLLCIAFCFLIANNGIAYYPAFSCFFILITGVIKSFDKKNYKAFFQSFVCIGLICTFFFANFVPFLIYKNKEGINNAVAQREVAHADMFGLKISQLLLPQHIPQLPKLETRLDYYHNTAPLSNENKSAYLGFAGSLGFLFLVYKFLTIQREEIVGKENITINLLGKLNLCGILLATIGGFGTIFAVLVTPQLRCYNRISVFIAFIAISGLFLGLQSIKFSRNKKKIIKCLAVLITFFSISVQFHRKHPDYKKIGEMVHSDKLFIEEIEKQVPEKSMIYQFPYHKFPEEGHPNNMEDYQELIGFLHSQKLKWSYGAIRGRQPDNWAEQLALLSLENKIKVLSLIGFQGIYVERRAYTVAEYEELDSTLRDLLMVRPLVSDNRNLSFYPMKTYNEKYLTIIPLGKEEKIKRQLLDIEKHIKYYGLTKTEHGGNEKWRWMEKEARIEYEYDGEPYTKYINFQAWIPGLNLYTLDISVNGEDFKYLINEKKKEISLPVSIVKGKNVILFTTNAPTSSWPYEVKKVYVKFLNCNLGDIQWNFEDILEENNL